MSVRAGVRVDVSVSAGLRRGGVCGCERGCFFVSAGVNVGRTSFEWYSL